MHIIQKHWLFISSYLSALRASPSVLTFPLLQISNYVEYLTGPACSSCGLLQKQLVSNVYSYFITYANVKLQRQTLFCHARHNPFCLHSCYLIKQQSSLKQRLALVKLFNLIGIKYVRIKNDNKCQNLSALVKQSSSNTTCGCCILYSQPSTQQISRMKRNFKQLLNHLISII